MDKSNSDLPVSPDNDLSRSQGFYWDLLDTLRKTIGFDSAEIIVFRKRGRPDYISVFDVPKHLQDLYLTKYYRQCPMLHYWQSGLENPVVKIREAQDAKIKYDEYWDKFYTLTGMRDEIGLFLPTSEDQTVGLFLARAGKFSQQEVDKVQNLYPAIVGLHQSNINMLLKQSAIGSAGSEVPLAIVDRYGQVVVSNRYWLSFIEHQGGFEKQLVNSILSGITDSSESDRPVRFEALQLGESCEIASEGYVIRGTSKTTIATQIDWHRRFFEVFEQKNLTPREQEIVRLVLDGYPNSLIAEKLGISLNTLKAHRKRLYVKLDITSERELFMQVIHDLVRD